MIIFFLVSINNSIFNIPTNANIIEATFLETIQYDNESQIFKGKFFLKKNSFKIYVFEPDSQLIIGNKVLKIYTSDGETLTTDNPFNLSVIFFHPEEEFDVLKKTETDYYLMPHDTTFIKKIHLSLIDKMPYRIFVNFEGSKAIFYLGDYRIR